MDTYLVRNSKKLISVTLTLAAAVGVALAMPSSVMADQYDEHINQLTAEASQYVERVNGDGTIMVSQYNYGLDGNYSEMTISGAGLIYIYFQVPS